MLCGLLRECHLEIANELAGVTHYLYQLKKDDLADICQWLMHNNPLDALNVESFFKMPKKKWFIGYFFKC